MKNGSDGSAAACSRPASRQRRTRPPGMSREPAATASSSRRATSSSRWVRTARRAAGRREAALRRPSARTRSPRPRPRRRPRPARGRPRRGARSGWPFPSRGDGPLARRQAVPRLELARGCGQVDDRDQDVIELQGGELRARLLPQAQQLNPDACSDPAVACADAREPEEQNRSDDDQNHVGHDLPFPSWEPTLAVSVKPGAECFDRRSSSPRRIG
jgi:hypothetical protein